MSYCRRLYTVVPRDDGESIARRRSARLSAGVRAGAASVAGARSGKGCRGRARGSASPVTPKIARTGRDKGKANRPPDRAAAAATHELFQGAVSPCRSSAALPTVVRNNTWNMRYACQSERSRELGRLLGRLLGRSSPGSSVGLDKLPTYNVVGRRGRPAQHRFN
jgi:hypothetical protein